MKKTPLAWTSAILLILGAGVALMLRHSPSVTTDNAVGVTGPATHPVAPAVPLAAKVAPFPEDERPEVQTLYAFARVADLYAFAPRITICQTNEKLRMMEVCTPTHCAEVVFGHIMLLSSHYGGSDTRAKPEAINEWHQCTGTWSEPEVVKRALDILERLGKRDLASTLASAKHEYEAESIEVRTPKGDRITVTPFAKVGFNDGNIVLRAEFRMGISGPAGLTSWFYLGP